MDLEAARKALVQESRELLSEMEAALLRMEKDGFDDESVHAVFRAAHTIKGSVGLFGLEHVVKFTHALESILDEIRSGKIRTDTGMISLFLECGDHLQDLVGGIESQTPETDAQVAVLRLNHDGTRVEDRTMTGGAVLRFRDVDETAKARKTTLATPALPAYLK